MLQRFDVTAFTYLVYMRYRLITTELKPFMLGPFYGHPTSDVGLVIPLEKCQKIVQTAMPP